MDTFYQRSQLSANQLSALEKCTPRAPDAAPISRTPCFVSKNIHNELSHLPLQATILTQRLAAFLDRHKTLPHGQPLPTLLAGDFNSLWRKIRSDPFDEVSMVVMQCCGNSFSDLALANLKT